MPISAKKGTFSAPLVTGNLAVTGVGFQPKALVLWGTAQTIDGFSVNHRSFVGVVGGSSAQVAATGGDDNVARTNTGRRDQAAAVLMFDSGTPTVDSLASFVSFDTDGFTLNFTDAAAAAWQIHYLALGGTDLVNAAVGTWTAPAAAGIQSVTGLSFTPDCLIHLGNTTSAAVGTNEASMNWNMGVATGVSDSRQWALAVSSGDAQATSIPGSVLLETETLVHVSSTANTILSRAKFAQFRPDGFSLNWTVAGTSGARQLYLALQTNGRAVSGVETQRTSTGTKAVTGIGATPVALLVAGVGNASSGSIDSTTEANFTLGATDGTAEGHIWFGHSDATTTQDVNQKTSTTKLLSHNANPSTLQAEADLQSFDSDGFTLNWTTADATARAFGWLAFTSAARTKPPALFGHSALSAAGGLYVATAGTTVTPVLPTHAADDILVCVASHHVASTLSISAGWTAFAPSGDTNPLSDANQSSGFWWRRAASGAESNPVVTSSVTNTTTSSLQAQVFRVRGCVTTGTPFEGEDLNAATAAATGTTPGTLAVTPTAPQRLVVSFLLRDDDPAQSSGLPPSGWSVVSNVIDTAGGDVRFISIARESFDTSAVAAATIATWAASVPYRSLTVAFIPESVGGIKSVQALVGVASTVTAAPKRTRIVAPLVGSSSTVTAAVGRRRPAGPALVGASSTVTVAPKRARATAALVGAASTVTVQNAVRRRAVAALVGAASTVTAAVVRRRAVVALVGSSSTVTAAVVRTRVAAAVVTGASTVAAIARRIRAVGGLPGYAQAVADDAPLIWWRLDDSAPASGDVIPDAGSLGLAGTIATSGVTAVAHPLALPGAQGQELAATNGAAIISATAAAGTLPTSAVTVECWYRTDYAVNWHNVINHDWGSSATPGWLLHLSTTAAIFGIWHTSGQKTAAVAMSYADGQWHHFVGVYDSAGSGGTGQVRLYVDGALAASSGGVGVYTLDDAGFVGAGAATAGSAGQERAIAEIAIYGTALSDARVAAHYAAGRRTRLSITSSSTVTVAPNRRRPVVALVGAASSVVAAVARRRAVAAVVGSSSTVSAFPVKVSSALNVAVGVAASSTVTAVASARRSAAALIAGAATVVATVNRRRPAGPALVGAVSTVSAAPGRRRPAGPVLVSGASSVVAASARRRAVVALVGAAGTVTAAPARRRVTAALIGSSSSVTVATARRRSVAVVVSGVSSVTVVRALGGIRSVQPTVSGVSSVSAVPVRRRTAAVLVASASSVSVAVVRRRGVVALVGASSTVVVQNRTVTRSVSVVVGAVSTVTAVPSVPVAVLVYFASPVYP